MTAPETQVAGHSAKQKLGTLEVGRGLAALAVVAGHAGLASDAFTSSNYGSMFSFGIYGVDFFFVLRASSFITSIRMTPERLALRDASSANVFDGFIRPICQSHLP